ncbi:MFS transporter [Marinobacterium stanieri]|uniref:Major Facilitator Superfamily protein n=1 Tax=Marinobacterium stanieri TaxID=49186 RepID=A0A1N6RB98_9GAMM|nr:MFS transporter [Marinobacterium stanieri]SIQ26160.1 hypothetical protein SAMN05421647_103226 [Marinobacterium stanieri]
MSKGTLSQDLYAKLLNEEDARACKAIDEDACKEVPGNFLWLVLSQFLTKLGDALGNPKVVLPAVMEAVSAPLYLLGFLVPIRESGSMMPQLLIAGFVRRLPIRKHVWVVGSLLQALCMMLIALVAWQLEGAAAGWSIIGLLVLFSLSRGLCSVAAKDVLGKTIPKTQRGRVNGWSASVAGLVTLLAGAWFVLANGEGDMSGASFGVLLSLAGLLWILAALTYSQIREFPGETDGGVNGITEAFKRLDILRTDSAFRLFVITRSLFLCSALSAPYYVVLAQRAQDNSPALLGLFIIASGAAGLISGPFWGRFADLSSRSVMTLAALMSSLAGIIVWAIATWFPQWLDIFWLIPLCYFALSIAHQGVRVGRKTFVVDMAEGNRRTDYVAVSNTVIGIVLLIMGFTGALSVAVPISTIILILCLMGLAGVVLSLRLPDV